jgi:hypothetical protein
MKLNKVFKLEKIHKMLSTFEYYDSEEEIEFYENKRSHGIITGLLISMTVIVMSSFVSNILL